MFKLKLAKSEKNLLFNIFAAFAIKGVSLLLSVFSTPQYINYFSNNTVLGVWYTVLSIISWITICDLGLGNGLRNKLTEALANGDRVRAKSYISSAYVAISVIMIPIMLVGIIVIQFLDLNTFLKLDASLISPSVLKLSVSILFGGICFNFILGTIKSVLYAIQKSSVTNFLALITSAIPLVYITFFKSEGMEFNLIALSIVHVLASTLPLLIATLVLFLNKLKDCAPSPRLFTKDSAKEVMGLGLKFFAAQLFFMLLMSTNELLINTLFVPDDVVVYNIYYKVFTTVGSLFMLALTPLWSKITDDIAKKRFTVLKKTNNLLYIISALAFVAQFAIIPILQWLLDIWLGDNSITVDIATALIFALFGGVYIFNNALNTIANGMGDLKTQVIVYGIASIIKIPAIWLLKMVIPEWNIIVLYNAVTLIVFCIIQFVYSNILLRKLSSENSDGISEHGTEEQCSNVDNNETVAEL